MSINKIQIEYRCTPLLDFDNIAKVIISPFQRFANLNLNEISNGKYILNFIEDGYVIDFRFDRIIFICFEEKENLTSRNGPLLHFLNIISKVESMDSFGKYNAILFAQWVIQSNEYSFNQNCSEFINKYLQNIEFLKKCDLLNDAALVLDFKRGKYDTKLQFGPFNPQIDPTQFNLIHSFTKDRNVLENKSGNLIQITTRCTSEKISLELISGMQDEHINILKLI